MSSWWLALFCWLALIACGGSRCPSPEQASQRLDRSRRPDAGVDASALPPGFEEELGITRLRAPSPTRRLQLPPNAGVILGLGYDSRTGEFVDRCVTGESLREASAAASALQGEVAELRSRSNAATTATLRTSVIEGTSQLSRALNAGFSVQANFGVGSASASFDYGSSTSMSSYSVNAVVTSQVTLTENLLLNPELTSRARSLQGNQGQFLDRCGDYWVSSVSEGGRFHAVLSIENSSRSDRETIRASLSGGAWGVTASVNFGLERTQAMSRSRITGVIKRTGGRSEMPNPQELTSLLEYAREFPLDVARAPANYSVELRTYDRIATQRNSEPRMNQQQQYEFDVAFALQTRLQQMIADRRYIISSPTEFACPNEVAILEDLTRLRGRETRLTAAARECLHRAQRSDHRWLQQCVESSGTPSPIDCPSMRQEIRATAALLRDDTQPLSELPPRWDVYEIELQTANARFSGVPELADQTCFGVDRWGSFAISNQPFSFTCPAFSEMTGLPVHQDGSGTPPAPVPTMIGNVTMDRTDMRWTFRGATNFNRVFGRGVTRAGTCHYRIACTPFRIADAARRSCTYDFTARAREYQRARTRRPELWSHPR